MGAKAHLSGDQLRGGHERGTMRAVETGSETQRLRLGTARGGTAPSPSTSGVN